MLSPTTRSSRRTASATATTGRWLSALDAEPRGRAATHIVVAGNVTLDRTPAGEWRPGGPSLYAARTAAALGARTTLITALTPEFDRDALAGLDVIALTAGDLPHYSCSYDAAGRRTLRLLATGEPMEGFGAAFESVLSSSPDAVLVAPALLELDGSPRAAGAVSAVSLQGALRHVDEDQRVVPVAGPARAVAPFVRAGSFAFFSEEDATDAEALARVIASWGATALVTRGAKGALLFEGFTRRVLAPVPAVSVDPTGAGDCFAAAFVVRLVETGDVGQACRYALAAGAVSVEGEGLAGVPGRPEVEARLPQEVT